MRQRVPGKLKNQLSPLCQCPSTGISLGIIGIIAAVIGRDTHRNQLCLSDLRPSERMWGKAGKPDTVMHVKVSFWFRKKVFRQDSFLNSRLM